MNKNKNKKNIFRFCLFATGYAIFVFSGRNACENMRVCAERVHMSSRRAALPTFNGTRRCEFCGCARCDLKKSGDCARGSVRVVSGLQQSDLNFEDLNSPESIRKRMRLLFNRHGIGMYVLIAAAHENPCNGALFDCAFSYILQNVREIAGLFAYFYGNTAGNELYDLLQAHALLFKDLVEVVGDANALAHAREAWLASIMPLAAYFNRLEPRWNKLQLSYSLQELFDVMYDQLTERHMGRIESQADVHLTLIIMLRDLADYFSQSIGMRSFDRSAYNKNY